MNIYWLLMIALLILGFVVQFLMKARFEKYSRVRIASGLTGREVAERMLRDNGIMDVRVISVQGQLTDHYNPTNHTINLSEGVYDSNSVAAVAVAAHETGHAIQHALGYAPLRLRSALVPVVTIASSWVQWILLAGIFLVNIFPGLLLLGIVLFAATTLFSFVTLPVEIDASQRALQWLERSGLTTSTQQPMAASALRTAAYTYVVAALSSLATLLYYVSIFNSRR